MMISNERKLTFRFILNASVTKPVSGSHCSVSILKFDGISSLDSFDAFDASINESLTAARIGAAFDHVLNN